MFLIVRTSWHIYVVDIIDIGSCYYLLTLLDHRLASRMRTVIPQRTMRQAAKVLLGVVLIGLEVVGKLQG